MEDFVRPNREPHTYQDYANMAKYYLIPHLGDHKTQKLRSLTIQQFYSQLLASGGADGQGLSAVTIGHIHATLSACLSYAVQHGVLKTNPCASVTPPPVPKRAPDVWDAEQVKRVLAAADELRYGIYAKLVLYTGLRANEALALRWANVDLDKHIVTVVEAIKARPKGKDVVTGQPKTTSGIRAVPFSPALADTLRAHRLAQKKERLARGSLYTDRGLVIATDTGNFVRIDNLRQRLMPRLAELADVPYLPPRNLRHTHATLLLAAGVHPKVVQERLGHSSMSITMDIYSSVLPSIQLAAVSAMDDFLSGTEPEPENRFARFLPN